MKFVYLIDKYDAWCPENNNGSHIVGAFLTEEEAIQYVQELTEFDDGDGYTLLYIEIGNTDELNNKKYNKKIEDVLNDEYFPDEE